MEKIYFLFAILIIISVWDARTFRIPNAFIAICIPISFAIVGYFDGWHSVLNSILGFMVSTILLYAIWYVFYITDLRLIGAGDYKLLMVISIFLGIGNTFIVFYYSIIFAAIIFLFILSPLTVGKMFKDFFYYLFYSIPISKPTKVVKLPHSIPISIGVLGLIYFHDFIRLFLHI